MRMAFLCPRYLSSRGGAELLTKRLAEEMATRGNEVTLIAAEVGESAKGFTAAESPRLRIRELRRARGMERLLRAVLGLERRRRGYRLFQMLTRGGRVAVMGKGPYCRDAGRRSLYANMDVVTLMGFNTPWEILFGRIADSIRPTLSLA
jgi:hypothetical protein